METFQDLVSGTIGGVAGIVAGQPFDTIKVRLQTQAELKGPAATMYTGPFDCGKKILRHEGVRGYFKGMLSPIVGNAPINAILFAVEGWAMREMESRNFKHAHSSVGHAMAGSLAGFLQTSISSPTELVKIRLQVERGNKRPLYNGPWECAKYIFNQGGVTGLYRGVGITLARDVPAFGGYFYFYHEMRGWFAKRKREEEAKGKVQPHHVHDRPPVAMTTAVVPTPADEESDVDLGAFAYLMSGGVAGFMSWALLHPIDVLKSCQQMLPDDTPARDRTLASIARRNYKLEGWHFFFRGYIPTLLRAFPVSAVTFCVFEWSLSLMQGRMF